MTDNRPHSEPALRPRPQYGEYASPEQQAAAMGVPYPPVTPAAAPPPYGQRPAAAEVRSRRWDQFLTILLLAYGLYSVISGFFQFSDLSGLIDQVYKAQGIGAFTSTHLASVLGMVINVADVVIFLVVAVLAAVLLRRGRVAFYVPLIGGVLSGIVIAVCLLTLMLGDPAFTTYVNGMSAGT